MTQFLVIKQHMTILPFQASNSEFRAGLWVCKLSHRTGQWTNTGTWLGSTSLRWILALEQLLVDPTLSIRHIHPDGAHRAERLPLPPLAPEGPTPWVRHYGSSPKQGNPAPEELSQDQTTKHACSYDRGRRLATLSQISPLRSLFGPCSVLKIACQCLNTVRFHIKV